MNTYVLVGIIIFCLLALGGLAVWQAVERLRLQAVINNWPRYPALVITAKVVDWAGQPITQAFTVFNVPSYKEPPLELTTKLTSQRGDAVRGTVYIERAYKQ